MNTTRTLQEIASHFGCKVWKDSRVYLPQFGYKTKKMQTNVYIYIQDSEIKVSVFIDCPSQPYAWITSQKEQVIQKVYSALEEMEQEALEHGGKVRVYGEGHNEIIVETNTPPALVASKMNADTDLLK